MEKLITLPKSGALVTFRDPDTLRQKDREQMWTFLDTESPSQVIRLNSALKGLMAVMVKSWTLEDILPSIMPSSLGELATADYDAIAGACQEWIDLLNPDFTSEAPDSPKANLNASDGN